MWVAHPLLAMGLLACHPPGSSVGVAAFRFHSERSLLLLNSRGKYAGLNEAPAGKMRLNQKRESFIHEARIFPLAKPVRAGDVSHSSGEVCGLDCCRRKNRRQMDSWTIRSDSTARGKKILSSADVALHSQAQVLINRNVVLPAISHVVIDKLKSLMALWLESPPSTSSRARLHQRKSPRNSMSCHC